MTDPRPAPGARQAAAGASVRWPGGDGAAGAAGADRGVSTPAASGWELACLDAVGRPRQLTIRAGANGGAIVGFPPGGTAVVPRGRAGTWAAVVELVEGGDR